MTPASNGGEWAMSEAIDVAAQGTPDQQAPAPAAAGDRIDSLDFIRGLAVMGILAANIVAFGQPFAAYMYPDAFAVPHGAADDWLWVAQFVVIDGKMRGLFTLLFGAGLMLFMEKAWARGATRWLQARRLFWLALFGLLHFYLLWRGDILFLYAIAGSAALLCLGWQARTQLTIGLLGYLAGAIFYAAAMMFPYMIAETDLGEQVQFAETRDELAATRSDDLADARAEVAVISDGSYADYVRHTVEKHGAQPFAALFFFLFETLPLMLIGMALFRFGLLDGSGDRRRIALWAVAGVAVGTALTVPIALWAHGHGLTYWSTLAAFMGMSTMPRLPVVIGLALLLALWGASARGWLAERVRAAGRAAFTNYLGTSLVMLFVFHGWGGGLFAELGRPQLYLVVLLAWVLMLAWSKPWLDRFRYGPLEWLWRCLTYGRLFPLRR
jgi:uncharacterized protein